MENYCKTLPNREYNDMYKHKSLGFMGEAMHSLVRSSQVTVFTRERALGELHGYKLQYSSEDAHLTNKVKVETAYGTTV